MLNDIIQCIISVYNAIWGAVDLVVQLYTGLVGLIRWSFISVDVSQELVWMVPWDIGTIFMSMAIISVLFVIFGRIK